MPKVPYDDEKYVKNCDQIERLAWEIFNMEGSDMGTLDDLFEKIKDNIEDNTEN